MYVELINEITIMVSTESMLLYTSIIDPIAQNRVGWISFILFVF